MQVRILLLVFLGGDPEHSVVEYQYHPTRQARKSFILKQIIDKSDGVYLSLDDPIIREEIKHDHIVYPGREIAEISPNIIAVPDWWLLGCYGETNVG